ncbi:MAG: hypothetical protein NTW87_09605 [Planctomycetota bacterium]|nr:hypothetical protein [Planctomycetota bacterium]
MLRRIVRVLWRPLTSESRDASAGSIFLYAAGLLVFVLSTLEIASLRLTEAQLVLGLLVSICVTMQFIVLGMLVEVRCRLHAAGTDKAPGPDIRNRG